MNSLLTNIDNEVEKRSLLKHKFYQMWSNGELNLEQLRGYSKEYFQLVKVVPKLVENVGGAKQTPGNENESEATATTTEEIKQNMEEESSHISPWIEFATSLGVPREELLGYQGLDKTRKAVSSLLDITDKSFDEGVCAMYAYELELPKISRSKIDGLEKFYNISSPQAINYFEIHEEADVRHANVWRKLIKDIESKNHEVSLKAASRSLDAQNMLLDAVYEKYVVNNN